MKLHLDSIVMGWSRKLLNFHFGVNLSLKNVSLEKHVLLLIFEKTAEAILGDLRFRLPSFATLLGLVVP